MADVDRIIAHQQRELGERDAGRLAYLRVLFTRYSAKIREIFEELLSLIRRAIASGVLITKSWLLRQPVYLRLIRAIESQMGAYGDVVESILDDARKLETERSSHDVGLLLAALLSLPGAVKAAKILKGKKKVALLKESSVSRLFHSFSRSARIRVQMSLNAVIAKGWDEKKAGEEFDGDMDSLLHRAQTIMRTEGVRAYREGAREAALQSGSTRWMWRCRLSPRTCLNCLSKDGSIHPITVPMASHIRCMCIAVLLYPGQPIPERQTGAEWFEEQDDDTQQRMMGIAAHALWKAGEISLADFEGTSHSSVWGPGSHQRSLKSILASKERKSA